MRPVLWGAAFFIAWLRITLPVHGEENSWVPGLSGYGGFALHSGDAQAQSSAPGRRDIDGDSDMLLGALGLSAELMTPKLTSLMGRPALFAHGDVGFDFSPGWNVAKEGSPGKVTVPLTQAGGFPPPMLLGGQGTAARAEPKIHSYGAGIGLAFEFALGERTLRLRPSFEYRLDEIDYRLHLVDPVAIDLPICPCGIARLSVRKQEVFHSIGPGLELEMDAARAGPVMVSVFASGRAYHLLGNEKSALSTTEPYEPVPSQPPLDVTASATFERDPWTYTAGIGLRFRWLPDAASP